MSDSGNEAAAAGAERNPDRSAGKLGGAAPAAAPPIAASPPTAWEVALAERDESITDPGPENGRLAAESPSSTAPPPTDHGDVASFWYSFAIAKKRVQEGGWARQVNVKDFPISTTIASVNMRLTAGGIRELHWHAAAEWAIMLSGSARLTGFDVEGKSFVGDVEAGDLWFFPAGIPHSIQGLSPSGCEFLLIFDDGAFSEFNTTLLCDWLAHTPREVIAKDWGVPESALTVLPPAERYIFQASLPGSLEDERRAASGKKGRSSVDFSFKMLKMKPTKEASFGEVRIVDSGNFPASSSIAAAHVRVRPGGLREMHWHPNADEWQYYIQGSARMTLFMNGGDARTMDFHGGDIGYVPRTMGHYIENTGDADLVFLEIFRSSHYEDMSLAEWLTRLPPELVKQHLHIGSETLSAIPREKPVIVPA